MAENILLESLDFEPPQLDLRASVETPPKPRDFVLPGLRAGSVGALVSPGAGGKTMLALQMSVTVSTGLDMLNLAALGGWTPATGHVVYLSAEDPADVLSERIHYIGQRLDPAQREMLYENLSIRPLVGYKPDIKDPKWKAWMQETTANARLVIVDTLRRFHNLEENDSGHMADLLGDLEQICLKNSTTVLYLHHTSKAGAGSDAQQSSRGSSVLTDNVRYQAHLVGMSADEATKFGVDDACRRHFVRLCFPKLNYGSLPDLWLRRGDQGVLERAVLDRPISQVTKSSKNQGKGAKKDDYAG